MRDSLLATLLSDYKRHGSSLTQMSFWAVAVYRFGRWSLGLRARPLRWLTSKVYGGLFLSVEMATGITLHREAFIGKEVHLVHCGNIKVHPGTRVGDRCGIMHDVTLGTNMEREGAPTVGDDVFIGAGAKVLGSVRIGDRARIGANSLVLKDVPADATAVGVPARVVQYTGGKPRKTRVAAAGEESLDETVASPTDGASATEQ